MPASQKEFRALHPRLDAELVWRHSKQHFKLSDEVKARDPSFPRDICDRKRLIMDFDQHLARPAKPPERIVPQKHDA